MKFRELPMEGSFSVDLEKLEDDRGFFARFWSREKFSELGIDTNIVQINNSLN